MIACLVWGSLVWDKRDLKIKGGWSDDGPEVRVEYLRQSRDGRMTLVLDSSAKPVRSYWSEMDFDNVEEALKNLAKREGTDQNQDKKIGCWSTTDNEPENIINLSDWASSKDIEHVLWDRFRCKI